MKRIALALCLGLFAPACGGEDKPVEPDASVEPDAPVPPQGCPGAQNPSNAGFNCPTQTARAWRWENDAWQAVGPADFSCLGQPSADTASTVDVELALTVRDFQTNGLKQDASISVFPLVSFDQVLATATSDVDGAATLTVPTGQKRIGFKVSVADALDTYTLNQYLDPDVAQQSRTLNTVSTQTATLVPALLGVTRTAGTGILAGSILDCSGNEVSDVIATVSSTAGSHQHLDGAQSYYFTGGANSLPTSHANAPQTNKDGLFVVIELPVAESAYLQIWGFTPAQDPATDALTLIAEIPSPVVADSVIIATLQPLQQ